MWRGVLVPPPHGAGGKAKTLLIIVFRQGLTAREPHLGGSAPGADHTGDGPPVPERAAGRPPTMPDR